MDKLQFKREVKRFLKEMNITQRELSEKTGFSQSILSDMINGKRNASRLVKYLNDTYGTSFCCSIEDMGPNCLPINRLDELMSKLKLTQAEFAEKLGFFSPNVVTNWKARGIGGSAFQKIIMAFPQVNPKWLMTGEGEMFKQQADEPKPDNDELVNRIKIIARNESRNASGFAAKIGCNSTVMFKVLHGTMVAPEELIEKILLKTNINRTWLMTGNGAMYKSDEVYQVPLEQESEPYTENKHGVKYLTREDGKLLVEVPIVPRDALGSPEDDYPSYLVNEDTDFETFEVDRVCRGNYFAF